MPQSITRENKMQKHSLLIFFLLLYMLPRRKHAHKACPKLCHTNAKNHRMAWEIWEADCCSVLRALSFPVRLVNTSASEVSVLWSRDNGPFLLLAKQICREECYRWAEVLAFCLRRCSLCWSQCSICERFCPWRTPMFGPIPVETGRHPLTFQ